MSRDRSIFWLVGSIILALILGTTLVLLPNTPPATTTVPPTEAFDLIGHPLISSHGGPCGDIVAFGIDNILVQRGAGYPERIDSNGPGAWLIPVGQSHRITFPRTGATEGAITIKLSGIEAQCSGQDHQGHSHKPKDLPSGLTINVPFSDLVKAPFITKSWTFVSGDGRGYTAGYIEARAPSEATEDQPSGTQARPFYVILWPRTWWGQCIALLFYGDCFLILIYLKAVADSRGRSHGTPDPTDPHPADVAAATKIRTRMTDDILRAIQSHEFGAGWNRLFLNDAFEYLAHANTPGYEFLDEQLEVRRQHFVASLKKLNELMLTNGFVIDASQHVAVPTEWDGDKRTKVIHQLNDSAAVTARSYRELLSSIRTRLRLP